MEGLMTHGIFPAALNLFRYYHLSSILNSFIHSQNANMGWKLRNMYILANLFFCVFHFPSWAL